ncbi:ImmA/IrrE family metallo-endopeptidase [Amantichitinum ursilacus]|uniref:ImmA/IrrE family metallo-endopeptidase n=1 Tax=Amantichitinum ursilacus TaxID=857265 RepID=UPI0006B65860|nr:ImmA/IrrE family metallo-endopeptidase [Amantichitinum ursilacus]
MDTIKIIKTEAECLAAGRLLNQMMLENNPADRDRMELLMLVIEDYERKHSPTPVVDPIGAIEFRMEQMGMTQKDLAPYVGGANRASELLARKRPLTLAMIRSLHHSLGIPAFSLLGPAEPLDISRPPKLDYSKFPLAEMQQRGLFGLPRNTPQRVLREQAEELVTAFLERPGAAKAGPTAGPSFLRTAAGQRGVRDLDRYALLVWMTQVRRIAQHTDIVRPWQERALTTEWLTELAQLSRFEDGPLRARARLANVGIALVIEPQFRDSRLDGASMLEQDYAVIGLTLRHDRLDHFWFVLMHELAHLKGHLSQARPEIADHLDDKMRRADAIEQEADAVAFEALVPQAGWMQSAVRQSHTLADAKTLAQQLNIAVAVVAGRVRRETGNWRLLSGHLGKGTVRSMFDIQSPQ